MKRAIVVAISLACCGPAEAVTHLVTQTNGVTVDRYSWTDSQGLSRTVSLKREGEGNPGHGGYAIQMTYVTGPANARKTIIVNAEPGDGFGYFVSHERYRDFTDGSNDTIAGKIFGKDDSPLGRRFAVTGSTINTGKPNLAAHRFRMTYPRYGTIKPIPKDAKGNDVAKTPVSPSAFKLYSMPVTITWSFEDGTDCPRISFKVGFGDVPGPDRVQFDVRGPYGVMRFDNGKNLDVRKVIWGDRFHFATTGAPVTRGTGWNWNARNRGARYHALIAGSYEMGLFEPRPFNKSALADSYADERGDRSTTFNGGNGCMYEDQLIPCDWEWPYQSLQYSLPENRTDPTNYKKIAWGSSAYYGTGPSLTRAHDTPSTSEPLRGFPADGAINYSVCVVLGITAGDGLTRAAAAGPTYNCASAP